MADAEGILETREVYELGPACAPIKLKSIKGADSKMPAPRHSISMNLIDDDD